MAGGIEFIPEEWVHSEPIEERIRPRPPPLPRAAVEKIKRIEVERIGATRPRGVPPPLPPEARTARLRGQPPPLPAEARVTRPRGQPPPIPAAARMTRPSKDEWGPGTELPKAPATINWTLPAAPVPANRNLTLLEHAQNAVEARAIAKGDAKSWYTTAAFEIRRAEITGNPRLLQSAVLSLDFAERSVKSFAGRVSRDRAEHVANIRSLREIVNKYLSQGLPPRLK